MGVDLVNRVDTRGRPVTEGEYTIAVRGGQWRATIKEDFTYAEQWVFFKDQGKTSVRVEELPPDAQFIRHNDDGSAEAPSDTESDEGQTLPANAESNPYLVKLESIERSNARLIELRTEFNRTAKQVAEVLGVDRQRLGHSEALRMVRRWVYGDDTRAPAAFVMAVTEELRRGK